MLNKYRNEFSIYHQPDFFSLAQNPFKLSFLSTYFLRFANYSIFTYSKKLCLSEKTVAILLRDDPKFPKNNLHTWPCMEWFLIIYHFLCHWTSSINMWINNLRRISSHSKVNELHTDSLSLSAALPLSLDHHHMWHSLSK